MRNFTRTLFILSLAITICEKSTGEVLFGHGYAPAGLSGYQAKYKDVAPQGKFFSTSDYDFESGKDDPLTGPKLGLSYFNQPLFPRGQSQTRKYRPLGSNWRFDSGWLSDGGKTVFGLTFDSPFKRTWCTSLEEDQFKFISKEKPLFDQAIICWGMFAPKTGSWGACVLDADGNFKKIPIDKNIPVYPNDMTIINFPPTTVKTLYFGVDGEKDNFVSVKEIYLNLHNPPILENRLVVSQPDAYRVDYSSHVPGEITGIQLANTYFSAKNQNRIEVQGVDYFLNNLSPFIESNGKKYYAKLNNEPVKVEKKDATDILRYVLRYALPNQKDVSISVTAFFGLNLENTVKFEFEAENMPENARLGFEMSSRTDLFVNYIDRASPIIEDVDGTKLFQTSAGPFGLTLDGSDNMVVETDKRKMRFSTLAESDELTIAFSFPIGPESGIQPEMLSYNWYPSLTEQGDEGVAPFKMEDLELMETINLDDPEDSHAVFDITNDPLILNWKKKDGKKLPRMFGNLKLVNEPEKGKVPLKEILGKLCRVINNNDTTYFRIDLQSRFNPRVPYLIVVEHAFDKERRGEFHVIGFNQTKTKLENLWALPAPFGGFDTGKGPYPNVFRKESVFYFCPHEKGYGNTTLASLCFSNSLQHNHNLKELPEGLAIKSVQIYRVKNFPRLPSQENLAPQGKKRHITAHAESTDAWLFSQWPQLVGYNTVWANHNSPSQFLHGIENFMIPDGRWYPGSLTSQKWLCEAADKKQMHVKIFLNWLMYFGYEDIGRTSFEGIFTFEGSGNPSYPLSPTEKELQLLEQALKRTMEVLSPYKSFYEISTVSSALSFFTKRNLDDFSKETGIKFDSSPVPHRNLNALLDSDQTTVDAWIKWSSNKRLEFMEWVLDIVRDYREDIFITFNQSWMTNSFMQSYYGANYGYYPRYNFNREKMKAKGIDNFYDFLGFIAHDPAVYQGKDGFCFSIEKERDLMGTRFDGCKWTSPYKQKWFDKFRDCFEAGLSIQSPFYDESPKPLVHWTCTNFRDQQSFRRDLVEALLYANARDFVLQTYHYEPYRGRIDDLRRFAVPFELLPFAKPAKFAGKISDTAKQAVIKKYDDRYGLMNAGNKATEVTLILPEDMEIIYDLTNGIRQQLLTTKNKQGEYQATIKMEPWSLRTLEMKN